MKTTTLLRTILATTLVASLHAGTFDPHVDAMVLKNGHKADSTGYYGYLVETTGLPYISFDARGQITYFFPGLFLNYSNQPPMADIYAGSRSDGVGAVANARYRTGAAQLMNSYQLDVAAMAITREMFRQDWQGANFPDGKTLAYFLRQAGWNCNPAHVIAITRVRSRFEGLLSNGRFNLQYTLQRFPQVVSPDFQTMGYADGNGAHPIDYWIPLPGGGQTSFDERPDGGRADGTYYETLLLSTDGVATNSEAIYDLRKVDDLFARRSLDDYPTRISGQKGQRLIPSGLVALAGQLKGRAQLKGHLPPGIHFNPHTGQFSGVPRKAGVWRLKATATYHLVGDEGASGRHTTGILIRIRR